MNSIPETNATKWSDDVFLDELRGQSDDVADACCQELLPLLATRDFRRVFQLLSSNETQLPDDVPEPLARFFEQNRSLPQINGQPVDLERVRRGQEVFMERALPCALVLLAKSLPEGYAAPNLSAILAKTGNLKNHTYKRLLGVLQMVNNVSEVGGLEPTGKGVITAPKLRLLHAGIRHVFDTEVPEYRTRYGVPVNKEDMLATIMGFSYLVIEGLRRLKVPLSEQEAEDFYYVWIVYGQLFGIHPRGSPNSSEYLPANTIEAHEFYQSYKRRHYVPATENPDGVALAVANMEMLNEFMPWLLRMFGLRLIPRIYMTKLMGVVDTEQVGLRPVKLLPFTSTLVTRVPSWWRRMWQGMDRIVGTDTYHLKLSSLFFRRLVVKGLGGAMQYRVPDTLKEVRDLTATTTRTQPERRKADRRMATKQVEFKDRRKQERRQEEVLVSG